MVNVGYDGDITSLFAQRNSPDKMRRIIRGLVAESKDFVARRLNTRIWLVFGHETGVIRELIRYLLIARYFVVVCCIIATLRFINQILEVK